MHSRRDICPCRAHTPQVSCTSFSLSPTLFLLLQSVALTLFLHQLAASNITQTTPTHSRRQERGVRRAISCHHYPRPIIIATLSYIDPLCGPLSCSQSRSLCLPPPDVRSLATLHRATLQSIHHSLSLSLFHVLCIQFNSIHPHIEYTTEQSRQSSTIPTPIDSRNTTPPTHPVSLPTPGYLEISNGPPPTHSDNPADNNS